MRPRNFRKENWPHAVTVAVGSHGGMFLGYCDRLLYFNKSQPSLSVRITKASNG